MRITFTSKLFLTVVWALLAVVQSVHATHLRAGEITVERVCGSLQFNITVRVYTNTGSTVLFGGVAGEEDILDFGDGTWQLILQDETTVIPRPDLGPNIGEAYITVTHVYSGPGKFVISYREPNRNEGVLNMDNSVNTRFYIETEIRIDPFIGCNLTPRLLIPPIDQACTGSAFFHNPGAYDPDGDSLSYELVVPFSDRNLPVVRYQDPAANTPRTFYPNDYANANENGNGPPSFAIDPVTGTLTWDAPGLQGEYNIAFVIIEWRKINGVWKRIGFVRRDMQILVSECENNRPDLIVPADTCIEAGTTLTGKITGIDPDGDDVKLEAFSEILNLAPAQSPATFTPEPDFRPQPSEMNFEWNTKCLHVKDQPYQVVFKVTDKPQSGKGPKLVAFKTWNIKVVGPKPVWENPPVVSGRSATLDWEDYTCDNAETIQIWRRVDSFMYDPANCETGMPDFLGYELIKEVPANGPTTFVDDNGGAGLSPGATYCYRLVAEFPAPKGGESYMSEEVCTAPIKIDAPVITNVTVDSTSQTDGVITIKWIAPLDADPGFTPPFQYEIYRGVGFTGALGPNPIHTGKLSFPPGDSLIYVDNDPLNTTDNSYNYRIVAYDNTGALIDTSAVASSVRLEAKSQRRQIELTWDAFVPWSNRTLQFPEHNVYRGTEGMPEDQFELIGTPNVNLNGLTFTDDGSFNGTPLEDNKIYCYRVETYGSYGADPSVIGEPLKNYSQVICTQPSDSIPPCQVSLPVAVNAPDCDNYTDACGQNVFSNRIEWERPNTGDCQNDIAYYNVYTATSEGGQYTLHATNITDTFYEDKNLPSHARCYKVSAVDRSGNEGELSAEVCIDNCPYYELPNVFTPNNDGCNDVFSAYSDRQTDNGEEGGGCVIPQENKLKCARFVKSVKFRVYNRWGKEVYKYESGGERTIYIDWDGRDKDGALVSTGIYYYIAEVTFDSIDPSIRHQTIKGWVHVLL